MVRDERCITSVKFPTITALKMHEWSGDAVSGGEARHYNDICKNHVKSGRVSGWSSGCAEDIADR